MVMRVAAVMAILVFAICLVASGLQADNTFTTTVERSLTAMMATLVIGLVLGAMARKMLEENLKFEEEKLKKSSGPSGPNDR
jgi:NhaP-type Na+/H+ or K+/H+ antiporter